MLKPILRVLWPQEALAGPRRPRGDSAGEAPPAAVDHPFGGGPPREKHSFGHPPPRLAVFYRGIHYWPEKKKTLQRPPR